MFNFVPVELHTHTHHSDGDFSPQRLIEESIDFGYRGIVITDHNTSSAYQEMINDHLIPDDFIVLRGIEWTTYFGHMLVIDADYDVDWRNATPDTIDTKLKEVRSANGFTTIAHPYDIGSPICTGCHWEFKVKDYNLIDQIEIYNSNHPQKKHESLAAYRMWRNLLDQGYHIRASCGRDWHGPETSMNENWAVTYLSIAEQNLTTHNFRSSLDQGSTYFTLGPLMEGYVELGNGELITSGAQINCCDTNYSFQVQFKSSPFKQLKTFSLSNLTFYIIHNGKDIHQERIESVETTKIVTIELPHLNAGYLYWELRGDFGSDKNVLIALANPIFIQ